MTVKIPLRLTGIDLRQASAYELIDPDLDDLFFEANGGVSLAVVYTDDPDTVWVTNDAARRIAKLMSGVSTAGVHDELVSIADIAARCDVAAEAARQPTAVPRAPAGCRVGLRRQDDEPVRLARGAVVGA